MEQGHHTEEKQAVFGMVAEFDNPHHLIKGAKAFRKAGYEKFDTHSPFPVHGMDKAMGLGDSKLGWIVITSALLGGAGIFVLQVWAALIAYPFLISGKPYLSTEAYIPATFEIIILSAGFAAVFGMFMLNKLPKFYHPLFKSKHFYKASSHGFFLSVEKTDTQFEVVKTQRFFETLGAKHIEVVED